MAGDGGRIGSFRSALAAPGFRRLLIGQAVSSLGDWVATLAFIAAAYAFSGRNQTAVAVVLVLRLVPPVFAAPVGGAAADRWSRRSIMVTCDLLRTGLILLVPLFPNILALYATAFVHESISLFFLPARDATVPLLVPEGSLEQANGLILASSYGSLPAAAVLFGLLRLSASHVPSSLPLGGFVRTHPTIFAFVFDAATFAFSASMIAGLRFRQERRDGRIRLLTDVAEGIRYILRHRVLRALSYGLVVSMAGGGVLFAVGIGYVRQTLSASDAAFGWLAALWGAGMGVGLAAVRLLVRRGRGVVFVAAVTACGAILVFMALVPVLWLAFVAAVGFGAAFGVAVVLALSVAQQVAEDRMRGRVMGGVQMLVRVGLGAGALGVGAIAHAVGHVNAPVSLDGNQVGLIVGGALILLGAIASSSVVGTGVWPDAVTSPDGPPGPGPASLRPRTPGRPRREGRWPAGSP